MDNEPVKAAASRLRVMRGGRAMAREWKIPKPVVLVDTREQTPFPLAANHPNWIGGERRATLLGKNRFAVRAGRQRSRQAIEGPRLRRPGPVHQDQRLPAVRRLPS